MAIRGLTPTTITTFTGKNTTSDLSSQSLGTLIATTNVLILADGNVRRAPGYTQVVQLGIGSGPATAIYDFQRSVDQRQFKIYQRGTSLIATNFDDSNPRLLTTLASSAPLRFTHSAIACYATNGTDAIRLVDVSGTLTCYGWGLAKPSFTPTLAISPGTLTLKSGRRYVISPVSKYTDSLGIVRVHIGAPTPFSAYTGPVSAQAVTLGGWTTPTDPQQTHWWIFATTDSPDATSATFEFAAEITAATLAWADTLLDSQLDSTRLAPFENYPAPPSSIVVDGGFQSRQVLIQGAQMRLGGGSEVVLGIPDESFPVDSFYNVPTGVRGVTAATVSDDGNTLCVSNGDTWFAYTGYNSSTVTERDRIASPGQSGPRAGAHTPFGYVYLSPSKRLWLWDFSNPPVELSSNVAFVLPNTVGMESITDPSVGVVYWYSYGTRHMIVLVAPVVDGNGQPVGTGTWLGLWGVPAPGITGPNALLPTDRFPSDVFTTTGEMRENGITPFIYAGLPDGRIVRFPDGYLDITTPYASAASHAWIQPVEGRSRWYFIDLFLDTSNPGAVAALGGLVNVCQVMASVRETAEPNPSGTGASVPVPLVVLPVPTASSPFVLRGNLQLPAVSVSRYIRIDVLLAPGGMTLPFDIAVQKLVLSAAPVYEVAP